jgi:choline dehydrogenase-like flavoprotein
VVDILWDAIVIGTGFGGAVAACRLAQAGLDVLVLERGRRFSAEDFPDLPASGVLLPDLERWSWQSHQGLWDVKDLGPMLTAQAAGLGGGSLIYANVHLRPPPEVFDGWPAGYDSPSLASFYDLAGWMLDVAPIDHSAELGALPKTRGFDRAAEKLGRKRETFHPPLALRYSDGENAFGRELKACNGCGRCCLGCPNEAKSSLDHNYLFLAERYSNVRVKTRCEALAIHELAEGYAVEYRDELGGDGGHEVSAKHVFLCAGALGTTQLLARSAALARSNSGRGLPRLSSRLGRGYFGNGDAVSLIFDADAVHEPTRGPTITTATIHRDDDGFVLLQDGGYPIEMSRAANAFAAPAFLAKNRFRSGRATAARPSELLREPPPTTVDGELLSPLDALLRAVESGSLDAALPPQLQEALAGLREELMRETLADFEQVVDGMIERSIQGFVRRFAGHRLPAGSPLHDKLMQGLRQLTFRWLTDRSELASFAQRAFFERFFVLGPRGALPRALAHALGGKRSHPEHGAVLLAMGRDTAPTDLHYVAESDRLVAVPISARGFDVLATGERLQRDVADAMGGELRTSPAIGLLGKPMTVHSQGGCGMADSPEHGVTSSGGEVHGHVGLFVVDASLFPGSVGVNPSATVLAIAERNVLGFIRRWKHNAAWPLADLSAGAVEFASQREQAQAWARDAASRFDTAPPKAERRTIDSQPVGLSFGEVFTGFLARSPEPPQNESDYYRFETAGQGSGRCSLDLQIEVADLERFARDPERRAKLSGNADAMWPDGVRRSVCAIEGVLQLLVEGARVPEPLGNPGDRYFIYTMSLRAATGERAQIRMYKRMPRVVDRLAWRGTSRCYTRFEMDGVATPWSGIVRVDLARFVFRTLPSMQVSGTNDPARVVWALGAFARYFAGGFHAPPR